MTPSFIQRALMRRCRNADAAARTASALCARLTDADVAVRHNAALALAKMGTGDATALRRAQDDDDHYVRELSTVALARFQPVQ